MRIIVGGYLLLVLLFARTVEVQAAETVLMPPQVPAANLSSIGSDTLNNLMALWAEALRQQHPNINFQIQGSGSSAAPVALLQGTVNFGAMSRPMRESEISRFKQRFGYEPVMVAVAIDMLAIYVHRDNPLQSISLAELDAIYSVNRRCGAGHSIRYWGELGSGGQWQKNTIALYSRNAMSGTYGYFKQHVLCNGDFIAQTNELPGSAAVVQAVGQHLNSIGYSGIGYLSSGVKVLPLRQDGQTIAPLLDNALNGRYPLSRFLYLYLNKAPDKTLPAAEQAFMTLVLSEQGQKIVQQEGYLPLPENQLATSRALLGISD